MRSLGDQAACEILGSHTVTLESHSCSFTSTCRARGSRAIAAAQHAVLVATMGSVRKQRSCTAQATQHSVTRPVALTTELSSISSTSIRLVIGRVSRRAAARPWGLCGCRSAAIPLPSCSSRDDACTLQRQLGQRCVTYRPADHRAGGSLRDHPYNANHCTKALLWQRN